jgi:site-specific DNA-methyltransferase (adenine-specific)
MTDRDSAIDRNAWMTPPKLFSSLHNVCRFTLDGAASNDNALLPEYRTIENPMQPTDWLRPNRIFCNPPYGKGCIEPFVERAIKSIEDNTKWLLLLPVRTDMQWFHDLWIQHQADKVHFAFFLGRLKFIPPPGVKQSSPNERHFIVHTFHAFDHGVKTIVENCRGNCT